MSAPVSERAPRAWLDRWLFEGCSPRTCVLFRCGYALLLIAYALVWLKDGVMWFSDEGVMSVATAQQANAGGQPSLFFWLPATPWVVQAGLICLLLNASCLLLGIFPRIQALSIFVLLASFQHRNPLILDGEDTVFRMFAFFLIFLPARARKPDKSTECSRSSAWGLRLIQAQMCIIYLSAAWSKILSVSWQDGTALFYVYQMKDLYGRNPVPEFLTSEEWAIRGATWAVVSAEALLPLLLMFRPTRIFAICLGLTLHLSMEYAMHLHLFQWVMMLGLLSFLDLGPKHGEGETQTSVPSSN